MANDASAPLTRPRALHHRADDVDAARDQRRRLAAPPGQADLPLRIRHLDPPHVRDARQSRRPRHHRHAEPDAREVHHREELVGVLDDPRMKSRGRAQGLAV